MAVLQFAIGLVVPAALRVPTTFRRVYNKLQSALNGVVDEVSVKSPLKEDAGDAGGSSMIDFLCAPDFPLSLAIDCAYWLLAAGAGREKSQSSITTEVRSQVRTCGSAMAPIGPW